MSDNDAKGVIFPLPENVAECAYDDIRAAVVRLWPLLHIGHGRYENDFCPIVDGHWRVGFSLRLFGPGTHDDAGRRNAWLAMEQLQRALEDLGFETTRDGNAWQEGRLVLGWSITTDGARIVDLPEVHQARVDRRLRLSKERAKRDAGTT